MKNLLKTLLLSGLIGIYLIVSSSILVNVHYCCGDVKDVSFFVVPEKGCCGDKSESSGCCHDETKILKVDDKQSLSKDISFKLSIEFPVLAEFSNLRIVAHNPVDLIQRQFQNYHSPPLTFKTPIFIKNRVLII